MTKNGSDLLYAVLGIQEGDPGFTAVFHTLNQLGTASQIGAAFWQIETHLTFEEAFKRVNTSMLDRRIDSSASLLMLDTEGGQARWHLRQPLADLIRAQWRFQNNLLISFTSPPSLSPVDAPQYNKALLERMMQLGSWAPISKNLWYISTSCKTNDAFHFLTESLSAGDRISVLDSNGNVAFWHQAESAQPQRDDRKATATDRNALHGAEKWDLPKSTG